MLTKEKIQQIKDGDAFYRLYVEFLMKVYNDILSFDEFRSAFYKWLVTSDVYYRERLNAHYESLHWLLNKSIGSICFEVLKLNHLRIQDIEKSIFNKMQSKQKFFKFFVSYGKELERLMGDTEEPEGFRSVQEPD